MEPLPSTPAAADAIARVRYTHDAMIDLVIARPDISQNEIATHFGYSVGWVSQVFCSDAFQARLADRRNEIVNPVLTASVEDRIANLAGKSLDVLQKKLEATNSADLAIKCLEITTRARGYGARSQNINVQTNFVVALPAKAESAEAWAMANGHGNGQVIEAAVNG